MVWRRLRAGILGGAVALTPLGLVAALSYAGVVMGDNASSLALGAIALSVALGGLAAGGLAGRGPRRRREAKAVVGAVAGLAAALLYGAALEAFFVVRYTFTPLAFRQGNAIAVHPVRVSFAIALLAALLVAVAMLTAHLTARPLPPPRNSRRLADAPPAARVPGPPPTADRSPR